MLSWQIKNLHSPLIVDDVSFLAASSNISLFFMTMHVKFHDFFTLFRFLRFQVNGLIRTPSSGSIGDESGI